MISRYHLCDVLFFLVLWINVVCCSMKGWLILPISFMLFSDIVSQLRKTWILKLTPPWMFKYLIILWPFPFTFNLFFKVLIFSSLTVSHPIRFNQIVAFTSQKVKSLFANERTSLVSTALKFSMLTARKNTLIYITRKEKQFHAF